MSWSMIYDMFSLKTIWVFIFCLKFCRLCCETGVHDPVWWWAQASNLWGPDGSVVRFNLAHVVLQNIHQCILQLNHSSCSSPSSLCVHDPVWWWAQASNLWGPDGSVVRFNLAHVFIHSIAALAFVGVHDPVWWAQAQLIDSTLSLQFPLQSFSWRSSSSDYETWFKAVLCLCSAPRSNST